MADPDQVRGGVAPALRPLAEEIWACRACPRLVSWRESVARARRAAFAEEAYWGRPIAGFGDPTARLLVLGLAPAAHGANRTGRVFTGDRSGDFLYAALHRGGYANQPEATHAGDGLALTGCYVTAAVRCPPPANKPTPGERDACAPFLAREVALLDIRVVVALGAFAWDAALRHWGSPRPKPRFAHGAEVGLPDGGPHLVGSYHVSQQNTFTGRLTPAMLDVVLARAGQLAAAPS